MDIGKGRKAGKGRDDIDVEKPATEKMEEEEEEEEDGGGGFVGQRAGKRGAVGRLAVPSRYRYSVRPGLAGRQSRSSNGIGRLPKGS